MYRTTVNGKNLEIVQEEQGLTIDGIRLDWDIIRLSDGYYHIIYKHRSFRAELVRTDAETKTFVFKINGRAVTVGVKDKFDLLLDKMGMNAAAGSKINNVKAPMPGLIIELKVKTGDLVKPGDQLLVLEAMKMENILKSPGEGIVKNIKVKKGDSVEKGQVLIEF